MIKIYTAIMVEPKLSDIQREEYRLYASERAASDMGRKMLELGLITVRLQYHYRNVWTGDRFVSDTKVPEKDGFGLDYIQYVYTINVEEPKCGNLNLEEILNSEHFFA